MMYSWRNWDNILSLSLSLIQAALSLSLIQAASSFPSSKQRCKKFPLGRKTLGRFTRTKGKTQKTQFVREGPRDKAMKKKGGVDNDGLVSNRDSKGYLFATSIRQHGVTLKLILGGSLQATLAV
jgi:hypothetical protein